MFGNERKREGRRRRQRRVRKKVRGNGVRPRLMVFRSARHIYAQVISDEEGRTLIAASSLAREVRQSAAGKGNVETSRAVGELLARKCLEQSISQVVFDRNGFLYHGRVRALADAAREAGLKF